MSQKKEVVIAKKFKLGNGAIAVMSNGAVAAPCGEIVATGRELDRLVPLSAWYAAQPKRPKQPKLRSLQRIHFRRDMFGGLVAGGKYEVSRKLLMQIVAASQKVRGK